MPSISAVGNIRPGVDDDDPAVVLDHGHVLADLAQAAEREDPHASSSRPTAAPPATRSPCAPAPARTAARSLLGSPATIGSRSSPSIDAEHLERRPSPGSGSPSRSMRLVDRPQLRVDLARRASTSPAEARRRRSARISRPDQVRGDAGCRPTPPTSRHAQEDVVVAGEDVEPVDRAELVVVGLLDGDDVVDRRPPARPAARAAC